VGCCRSGSAGLGMALRGVSRRFLERVAVVGESPVGENIACVMDGIPE
jgi:hypothetical protein